MTHIYRGMDQTALDAAYNNAAGVPNSAALMDDFTRRSALLRQQYPQHLDMPYGPGPRNRIDYFKGDKPGPLLVFIHGGYWQMRAKENFSFLAQGALSRGMHVAMIGYTLAPDIPLPGIVEEIKTGLDWLRKHAGALGGDVNKMILSGWSAGAHLTAMCLDAPGVASGVAVSGIYDLTPVRLLYVNDKLRLTPEDVAICSPSLLPLSTRPLLVTYGMDELPGLATQSEEFAALRRGLPGKFLPLAGHNHFTIMEEMASAEGVIAKEIFALAGV